MRTEPTPNEIWRRGQRVSLWRYRYEQRILALIWPALRRIWRGF